MNKLAQKYIQPIPVLIVGTCMLLGILVASMQKASGWNALTYVFGCIFIGWLFAYGYIEQKYNIFLWALIGIGLRIFVVGIQGNSQVMISDLILEVFRGAFIGLLVEENARGIGIGAFILGSLAATLALLDSISGGLYPNSEKINNQITETGIGIVRWAWLGATSGGIISSSFRSAKQSRQKKMI